MKAAGRIARTRALMDELAADALVVRDNSDLMWLTGFERVFDTEQAHVAVITADACLLHTDSRYSTAMRMRSEEEGIWEIDDKPCKTADFVAAVLGDTRLFGGNILIDSETPLSLFRAMVEKLPKASFIERHGDIAALRAVKEPAEIEFMRAAQDVATAAFTELLDRIHIGMTEREVSLELEIAMRRKGADELSFASIVASGPNSANPHSIPGERRLAPHDLVVIDFGARVNGYCSDTTRTISVGGPTSEQQRIYDTVLRANAEVRSALRAGVTGAQMHQLAEDVLAQGGYGGCMGHSLGHGVGIEIHESPLLSPRYDKKLQVGNVVTDEPGIYIAGHNGVRIEDCGVITSDGYGNFCTLSHELQVVE